MTAGPPVGLDTFSAAAALRTSTAVPVLLHPGLIYVFRVVPTLGEPWELISQIQTTQPGRVVIGVSCLVFFQGHPSKYYEPFSALLNFKWKPGLQPPYHLSSLLTTRVWYQRGIRGPNKCTGNNTYWGLKNNWGMQSKNGLQNLWRNTVFFILC